MLASGLEVRLRRILFLLVASSCLGAALFHAWRERPVLTQRFDAGVAQVRAPSFRRLSAFVPPGTARQVARQNPNSAPLLAALTASSEGAWLVSQEGGLITRLAGSRLRVGGSGPDAAAARFLARYGPLVVRVGELSRLVSRPLPPHHIVSYEQTIGGRPVLGTKTSLVFDGEGNLVYLLSSVYDGPLPASVPYVPAAEAARIAAEALAGFRRRQGAQGVPFTVEEVQLATRLVYRMAGASVALAYRTLVLVREPIASDVEVFVDAISGEVLQLRPLVRK